MTDLRLCIRLVERIPTSVSALRTWWRMTKGFTDLGSFEVDEYMMIIVYRVCKCGCKLASALEVFSTDETSVNVDV